MTARFRVMRRWFSKDLTIGELLLDGGFLCFTLEDRIRLLRNPNGGSWRPEWKVPKATAIPQGTYGLVVDMSERFKTLMPRVCDVPLFAGIRWHTGNTEHDTEGCLILGAARAADRVLHSRDAFQYVFPIVKGLCAMGPVEVEYVDVDPPSALLSPP